MTLTNPISFHSCDFTMRRAFELHGVVFRLLKRYSDKYEVELLDFGKEFIRRLKIRYSQRDKGVELQLNEAGVI